jgi:carbonic anhydrase
METNPHHCRNKICPAKTSNTGDTKPKPKEEAEDQSYTNLLKNNREFVDEKLAADKNFFKDRATNQTPKYMLIGCADSRVPPNELTKTEPGEIFIHRNVANLVISSDINCMSTIQYAVEVLKVEHIIIMGHTNCGGIRAAALCNYLGLIDHWLQHIRDVIAKYRIVLDQIKDQDQYILRLTELTIKEQAYNLCKTSFIQKVWEEGGKLQIHGWIMDIETGYIKDLKINNDQWKTHDSYFKYNFRTKF